MVEFPPCSRTVPRTHHLPTSPTHIPQLDRNLDHLNKPDYAPVPDPLCPRLLETCANHLASEPNEPEHLLAQEFVLRLCPKIIPVMCDEFRKHARYKNVKQCMKYREGIPCPQHLHTKLKDCIVY